MKKKIAAAGLAVLMAVNTAAISAFADNNLTKGGVMGLPIAREVEINDIISKATQTTGFSIISAEISNVNDIDYFKLPDGYKRGVILFNPSPDDNVTAGEKPWKVSFYNKKGNLIMEYDKIENSKVVLYYDNTTGETLYAKVTNTSTKQKTKTYQMTFFPESAMFSEITTAAREYVYRGRKLNPTVTVKTKDGTVLVEGKDYVKKLTSNTNVGDGKVTITGIGMYEGLIGTEIFHIKQLHFSDPAVKSDIKVTIPYASYEYTGGAIKPKVTVKYKGNVIPESDYDVEYFNNTKVGTAYIKVKGKSANLGGEYERTFVIKPATNAITSLTSTKGAFKVKWKKATVGATGYQVRYSTTKDFSSNVHSYTSTNLSDLSENFSKVPKSGETWYVQVRSFVTKDGKTTSTRYGNYSAVKSIKVK